MCFILKGFAQFFDGYLGSGDGVDSGGNFTLGSLANWAEVGVALSDSEDVVVDHGFVEVAGKVGYLLGLGGHFFVVDGGFIYFLLTFDCFFYCLG